MSCLITKGRKKGCKDGVSGVRAVYFINDLSKDELTFDLNGIITDVATVPAPVEAFKYELRADAEFNQDIKSDANNGTTYFEQKLAISLHSMTASDHKEIKLLAYGSPRIIVETNGGKFFLMGLENGADLSTGQYASGKAMGDMNGYVLEFMAQEPDYAPFMDADPATVGFDVVVGL